MKKDLENICILCGSESLVIYKDLKDYLYGVPGMWDLVKCKNSDCGLVWLMPKPAKENIKNFYTNYYTHEQVEKKKITFKKKFDYFLFRFFKIIYSLLRRLLFINVDRQKNDVMFLSKISGKVLEIGCGNGERLYKLKKMGWDVQGIEIDEKAIEFAKSKFNIEVFLGDIRDLQLPDNNYDAIIMNHVIEHIYEPIEFLKECKRVLKSDGKLILTTPNFNSYSHYLFGQYWRGLEPPRHLYIFSFKSLKKLFELSGFEKLQIWTSTAKTEFIVKDSLMLKQRVTKSYKNSELFSILKPWYYQIKFRLKNFFSKNYGDECIVIAKK